MEPESLRSEADLIRLRGCRESQRLEFKLSLLLVDRESKAVCNKDKIAENLSREVSAFANTEGGQIIVGMKERKEGKAKVADDLDEGVDPSLVSPEWLQQVVESNLHPYLPNIRVRTVSLSGTREGRVAFVIYVPKGTTAYQAKDRMYYSRSEFGAQPMLDHDIRVRMWRGRVAEARLQMGNCRVFHIANRHEYNFRLLLVNTGEITLKDWELSLRFESPFELRSSPPTSWYDLSREQKYRPHRKQAAGTYIPPEPKIFPGEAIVFPEVEMWTICVPDGKSLHDSDSIFHWTVYLEDSLPNRGTLNVKDAFSAADGGVNN